MKANSCLLWKKMTIYSRQRTGNPRRFRTIASCSFLVPCTRPTMMIWSIRKSHIAMAVKKKLLERYANVFSASTTIYVKAAIPNSPRSTTVGITRLLSNHAASQLVLENRHLYAPKQHSYEYVVIRSSLRATVHFRAKKATCASILLIHWTKLIALK